VTTNTKASCLTVTGYWNEQNLNSSASNNWRASLVPAAAVIPAPRVYTKAVAVKTLVVEFRHPVQVISLGLGWDFNSITELINNSGEERTHKMPCVRFDH